MSINTNEAFKQLESEVDFTGDLEYTSYPEWNNGAAFVVRCTGMNDGLEQVVKADLHREAIEDRRAGKMAARNAIQAMGRPIAAVTGKLGSIASNVAEDVDLKFFDVIHGTDLLEEKKTDRMAALIERKRARHNLI